MIIFAENKRAIDIDRWHMPLFSRHFSRRRAAFTTMDYEESTFFLDVSFTTKAKLLSLMPTFSLGARTPHYRHAKNALSRRYQPFHTPTIISLFRWYSIISFIIFLVSYIRFTTSRHYKLLYVIIFISPLQRMIGMRTYNFTHFHFAYAIYHTSRSSDAVLMTQRYFRSLSLTTKKQNDSFLILHFLISDFRYQMLVGFTPLLHRGH